VRARILATAAVFPVALTGTAVWLITPWAPATVADLAAAGASAALALLGWAGFAFLAAHTRPERAEWTPEEAAALKRGADLAKLLDATPRKGKR
jgi:hypothetical protein